MTTLTWTELPTSSSAVTLFQGDFSSPVSAVSLQQTELTWPWTTFAESFNPSGQMTGFCLEYSGQGYTYQGSLLVASNCPSLVASNTYQFSFTGDISKLIVGSYLGGAPEDVSYTTPAASVPEPSVLGLLVLGLVILYAKVREVGAGGAVTF